MANKLKIYVKYTSKTISYRHLRLYFQSISTKKISICSIPGKKKNWKNKGNLAEAEENYCLMIVKDQFDYENILSRSTYIVNFGGKIETLRVSEFTPKSSKIQKNLKSEDFLREDENSYGEEKILLLQNLKNFEPKIWGSKFPIKRLDNKFQILGVPISWGRDYIISELTQQMNLISYEEITQEKLHHHRVRNSNYLENYETRKNENYFIKNQGQNFSKINNNSDITQNYSKGENTKTLIFRCQPLIKNSCIKKSIVIGGRTFLITRLNCEETQKISESSEKREINQVGQNYQNPIENFFTCNRNHQSLHPTSDESQKNSFKRKSHYHEQFFQQRKNNYSGQRNNFFQENSDSKKKISTREKKMNEILYYSKWCLDHNLSNLSLKKGRRINLV